MCGIAGFIVSRKSDSDRETIARMLDLLRHRGPDDQGVFRNHHLTLGHCRLSILDVYKGQQPMASFNGNSVIAYNGEVFNYKELREELSSKGVSFRTACDTEVVVNAYEYYGRDFLKKLNGQFALAIFDKRKRQLFLARDPFGILPLFYYRDPQKFIFASEIKSLFAFPGVPREISAEGLSEIVSFWGTAGKRTSFRDVLQVPAGHWMEIDLETRQTKEEKYWDVDFPREKIKNRSAEEWSENLRYEIGRSVRRRLQADVPVGCYLSGGIDSSVITWEVFQQERENIKSFSVSFESERYDESYYQNLFFKACPIQNRSLRISNQQIHDAFQDVIWHAESAIFRTAPVPMYLLSELVRKESVRVILTGEGSDEILWGYDTFKELKIRSFWLKDRDSSMRPALLRRLFPQFVQFQEEFSAMQRLFYQDSLRHPQDEFFSHSVRFKNNQAVARFFSEDRKKEIAGRDSMADLRKMLPPHFSEFSPLEKCQYLECKTLLQGYLLSSQGDRMAMAHSVELRFPFLDPDFVRFVSAMPDSMKMPALKGKNSLKRAYQNLLPKEIVERQKHAYQAPDIDSFMRPGIKDGLVERYLNPSLLKEAGLWNPAAVENLVKKYSNGKIQAVSFRDNMAFVVILSSMILYDLYVKNYPSKVSAVETRVIVHERDGD